MKGRGISPAALGAAMRGDLDNFLVASTPGGIERQEAMGQAALVGTKNILPKQCPRAELEKMGFVFGTDSDDIFINVTFPKGWSKKATDHSMWSDLLDDKGRKRGSIFYKAAFYDRSAHMSLDTRYSVKTAYLDASGKENYNAPSVTVRISAADCDGTILFTTEQAARDNWGAHDLNRKLCTDWLDEKLPHWKDVTAYWN